jgi:thiamine-phosphate pyrophosphorylase
VSKPGYQSKLGADFKLDKTNIKSKVIALGGVKLSNLANVKAMCFDGAAVLGTLWNKPDEALERFKQLKKSTSINEYECNDR